TRWLSDHLAGVWSGHPRFADLRVEAPLEESIMIVAQPTLLGHALDNLLDNAFKYSVSGSPVCIEVVRGPDAVVIAVEDRGRGIAAEDMDRVFDPFFRAGEVKQAGIGGVGLGLAVTARIVTAFGGSVGVKGRPGGGSRFVVRFPCHPVRGNP
ncbi:MAG: histidine kinase, partial [Planctomycetaceae bacterium]|nr:histidine kinase [Planctomycetaceae bacterium]